MSSDVNLLHKKQFLEKKKGTLAILRCLRPKRQLTNTQLYELTELNSSETYETARNYLLLTKLIELITTPNHQKLYQLTTAGRDRLPIIKLELQWMYKYGWRIKWEGGINSC